MMSVNELFGFFDDDSLLNKGGGNHNSSDGGFDSNNGAYLNQCEELDDKYVYVQGPVQFNVGGSNVGENQIEDDHDGELDVGPTTRMRFRSLDEMFNFYQLYVKLKEFSVVRKSLGTKNFNVLNNDCLACDKGEKTNERKKIKKICCLSRVNGGLGVNGIVGI
ncbi:hypothetical protein PVK06_019664 [Gossypium arboreum]|uniref:Uncharacterized protein n=1 Tax=Gossypium arboreum TaxID=29729 RepID=A0ABR0PKM3_GOSAR|nr:hypothetical protein PVK06_019664 [Gossypium arboreum]